MSCRVPQTGEQVFTSEASIASREREGTRVNDSNRDTW